MRNLNSAALVLDPASDLQQQRSRWAVSTGCARGYQCKYSTCSPLSSSPGDRNSCPLILQHGYDMNHTHPFPTIYTASSPGTATAPYPGFPPPGIPHPGAQYAYPPIPPHLIVGHPNAVPNGAPYPASPMNGGFYYPPSPTASGPMPPSSNASCVLSLIISCALTLTSQALTADRNSRILEGQARSVSRLYVSPRSSWTTRVYCCCNFPTQSFASFASFFCFFFLVSFCFPFDKYLLRDRQPCSCVACGRKNTPQA